MSVKQIFPLINYWENIITYWEKSNQSDVLTDKCDLVHTVNVAGECWGGQHCHREILQYIP